MKLNLLLVFIFLLANFLLVLLHLKIFKSSVPFAAWGTGIVHIILLIIFPYKKLSSK